MRSMTDLQILEQEARRLRTGYAHDTLIRLLVELDLAIRRAACLVRARISEDFACQSESR